MDWIEVRINKLPKKLSKSHFYSWPQPPITNTYEAYEGLMKYPWWYDDLIHKQMEIGLNKKKHAEKPFKIQRRVEHAFFKRFYDPLTYSKLKPLLIKKNYYQKHFYSRLYKNYMYYEDSFIDDLYLRLIFFQRLYHNSKLMFINKSFIRRLIKANLRVELMYYKNLYYQAIITETVITRKAKRSERYRDRRDRFIKLCIQADIVSDPRSNKLNIYRCADYFMDMY